MYISARHPKKRYVNSSRHHTTDFKLAYHIHGSYLDITTTQMPPDIAVRAKAAATTRRSPGGTLKRQFGELLQRTAQNPNEKRKMTIYLRLSNLKASASFCEVKLQVCFMAVRTMFGVST